MSCTDRIKCTKIHDSFSRFIDRIFFSHQSHRQTQQCDVIPIAPSPLSLTSLPIWAPNHGITGGQYELETQSDPC